MKILILILVFIILLGCTSLPQEQEPEQEQKITYNMGQDVLLKLLYLGIGASLYRLGESHYNY